MPRDDWPDDLQEQGDHDFLSRHILLLAERQFQNKRNNGTIVWIIAVVVAQNRENLATVFDSGGAALSLAVGLLALNILGYLAGFGGGAALGLPDGMRRALTIEIGMQNAGLGTSLVQQFFKDEPAAALPPALYTFGCMLTGTLLAQWWSRNPPANDGGSESATKSESGNSDVGLSGSDD